jgi:hypothetical protein
MTMKQSYNKSNTQAYAILINSIIAISAITIYIVPYGSLPENIISILQLSILVIAFVFALSLGLKIKINDIYALFTLTLISSLYFSGTKIYNLIFIVFLLIGSCRIKDSNKKIISSIYFVSCISIIYQLIYYSTGRIFYTLSVPDPNFSGFYMLLFFMFCFRNNFIFGILLSILCVFLFVSRAYAISLSLFAVIYLFETLFISKDKKLNMHINNVLRKIFNRNIFFSLVLIANLSLYISSAYIIEITNSINGGTFARDDISRLVTFNAADSERFEVNSLVIQALISDPKILLFGIPERTPEYMTKFANTRAVPHNSLLRLVLECGLIFGLYYLFIVGLILKRLYAQENIKYILSFITFSLFLHVAYQSIFLAFLVSILSLPERDKKINIKVKI